MKLDIINKHWKPGFKYGYEKKRVLFQRLVKFLEKRPIVGIVGLRRTGKTVLMQQLMDHLIDKGVPRRNVLYFTFDESVNSLEEVITEYLGTTGVDLGKDRVYLFLDEIQKLREWATQIKIYYDTYPNLKFVVSGSQSLFIRESKESLAGRIITLELPILSFKEFLEFRDKEHLTKNPKMFPSELESEFLYYLKRNFIEIVNEDDEFSRLYLESIVNKVILGDIPTLFAIDNPEKLRTIFMAIVENPGMLLEYKSIAKSFSLNERTVERYVRYLSYSNMIKKVYNYSGSFIASERKLKKAYPAAPCFSLLGTTQSIPKNVENSVALDPRIKFFWRTSTGKEVDFVIKEEKPLPVEVKFKKEIPKKDLKPLRVFMKKFGAGSGVLLSRSARAEIEGITIKPAHEWFLE